MIIRITKLHIGKYLPHHSQTSRATVSCSAGNIGMYFSFCLQPTQDLMYIKQKVTQARSLKQQTYTHIMLEVDKEKCNVP